MKVRAFNSVHRNSQSIIIIQIQIKPCFHFNCTLIKFSLLENVFTYGFLKSKFDPQELKIAYINELSLILFIRILQIAEHELFNQEFGSVTYCTTDLDL